MRGIILGIGIIIVLAGMVQVFYSESLYLFGVTLTYYPYRNYGYIVLLMGFVTCVIGGVIPEGKVPYSSVRTRRATAEEKSAELSQQCKYLLDNQSCKALANDEEEGKVLRKKFCTDEVKDFCCYLCDNRKSCKISCNYLGGETKAIHVKEKMSEDIEREIDNCKERLEKLADLFAEGEIGEQSYIASTKVIENKIERLAKVKEPKKRQS